MLVHRRTTSHKAAASAYCRRGRPFPFRRDELPQGHDVFRDDVLVDEEIVEGHLLHLGEVTESHGIVGGGVRGEPQDVEIGFEVDAGGTPEVPGGELIVSQGFVTELPFNL